MCQVLKNVNKKNFTEPKKIPCIFALLCYLVSMKEKKPFSEKPLACFLIGIVLTLTSFGIALHGGILYLPYSFAVLVIAACFFSKPISSFMGDFISKFYTGSEYFGKPQPAYSLPDGLAATGQNACAIIAYNELAKNHPEEIMPHLRVMKIWIEKMNDVEAAIMAYNIAMKTIRGQKNRNEFAKMAKNNFSKFISFE